MKVMRDFHFSAAHSLTRVCDGHKCKGIHGHNYRVRIECCRDVLDAQDMVVDFGDIKAVIGALVEGLDHKNLNDVVGHDNVTCEWLCLWFEREIGGRLPVSAIEVWETDGSGARHAVG